MSNSIELKIKNGVLSKEDVEFKDWLIKKIEKRFGKKIVLDRRISESAKQI